MKVHNLTDVSTPALERLGFANISIKVGTVTLKPGESADFRSIPAGASRYIRVEALSVGTNPPKKYREAKEKLNPKEETTPETAPAEFQAPPEPPPLVVEDKVSVSDEAAVADTDPPADPAPRHRRYRSEG